MRRSVVLPHPLGPTRKNSSPAFTLRLTLSTARVCEADAPNTFGAVNTGQTFTGCGGSEAAPAVVTTVPADGTGGAALDASIDVTFSEDVALGTTWFDISCSLSGNHTAVTSGGPQAYSLNPDADFFGNEVCTVTVFAAEVSDVDADDPPDNMAGDVVFTFSTMVDSPMVINEVDADTAGSDALEFVELYDGGVGNTPLDGLVVVFRDDFQLNLSIVDENAVSNLYVSRKILIIGSFSLDIT